MSSTLTTSLNYATYTGGTASQDWTQICRFISQAFYTFGWVRTTDSGQGVVPGACFSITHAQGTGSVVTFTFNATTATGPQLASGMSFTVTGATTTGYNTTYTAVTVSINGSSSTVTANGSTSVTESETAFGWVNILASISHASGTGSVATYTYDDTTRTGTPIYPGMSITVAGCTTSGFNATNTVLTVSGGGTSSATFTMSNTTNTSESESGATAAVSCTTGVTNLTELWATNDSLSSGGGAFKVICKITYTSSGTNPGLTIQLGTTTNGSGTLGGITSTQIAATGANSTQTGLSGFASGDAGRMTLILFQNNTLANGIGATFCLNLERSLSNVGAYTNTYYTIALVGVSTSGAWLQSIYSAGGATTLETAGFPGVLPRTATTGNSGANTLVSPVYPLVGAVGNPMTGILLYRATDFSNNTQVNVTLYGTSYTYIAVGFNNTTSPAIWNAQQASSVLMRYS